MRTTSLRASPRGLYVVTRETDDTASLVATVRAALAGGAALVQYRDKSADRAKRLEQALALASACRDHGVPLIVNDDVALAADVGAGVHLGRDDASIESARDRLGAAAMIGVSCYDRLDRAMDAARRGADYLAFGSFFASPTKPNAVRAPLSLLAEARALELPVVAIGGITLDNARPLVAAGADYLAVISAVFDAPDPRAAALAFTTLFDVERTDSE